MCTICAATMTFDPDRHPDAGPDAAAIFEGADAPSSIFTPYSISVGDTFSGTIAGGDGSDYIAITLTAGETYEFNLGGTASGVGTLSDPYLYLANSAGTVVAANDDGGPGLESYIEFTASYTGTYYVIADAYGSATGTYRLSVDVAVPPAPGTLDELANYLTDGYWNFNGGSGRAFDTSGSNQITVDITALTASGQQMARWAFEVWELVANIDFVEVNSGADISFDDNQSGAFASSSVSGGTILSSDVNVSTSWLSTYGTTIDGYSFQTYIHEIGHALGLGHQGGYNGSATYGVDETFTNDSWQMSIMSYFDQDDNTTVNASFAYIFSAMMADIVAIQNLYGAAGAGSATAGNTTWGANSNLGGFWGLIFGALFDGNATSAYSGNDVAFTIYDYGGIDTLDLSTSTSNNYVDLRPEQFSNVNGGIGNVGIARGTVIEHLIAGSGNDTLMGNDADNDLTGGTGNDSVDGGAGTDTAVINATQGSITVTDLGGGSVRIVSADGTDVFHNVELFRFNDGTVTLAALLGGPVGPTAGNDTLDGTSGADTIDALAGNDVINGLAGADRLLGNSGDDQLFGGNGNDTLLGGADNDLLRGGGNADRLEGGTGNDTLFGDRANDQIFGGNGNDAIYGGYEHDLLRGGGGADTLNGELGNDRLFGDRGNDQLFGGNGEDSLYGGYEHDLMRGGGNADELHGELGNDTLFGDRGNDRLFGGNNEDQLYGGHDHDLLRGGANRDTLNGELGNDTLHGDRGNDRVLGGSGNDHVYGDFDHDFVHGGAGNDMVNGGTGNDTLGGGLGNDTFVFADGFGTDIITDFEELNSLEQIDFSGLAAITDFADLMANHATQSGANVVINDLLGNTITLNNVLLADLDASDFIF